MGGEPMSSPAPFALTMSRSALSALAIAFIYVVLALSGMELSRGGGQVASIWLPDAAVVAGVFICRMSLRRIAPAILLAHFALLLLRGSQPVVSLVLAAANVVEIAVVVLLARRTLASLDQIRDARSLARFLGIAGLGAAVSGPVGALAIAGFSPAFPVVLWQWWLAHAMAMMTFAPILLVIEADRKDGKRRGVPFLTRKGIVDILLGTLAVIAIFAQTRYPFLFFAAPVILAVAARRGSAASALLLLITALVATFFTMQGYGPINLVQGDMHVKAAVLQIFIFATFVSTLPVTLAQERTEALRERTLRLIETMNEIPFALDLKGRWTYAGRDGTSLFSNDQRIPLGSRALSAVPPGQRRIVLEAMSALQRGDVDEARFQLRVPAGRPEPLHLVIRARLTHARDGSPEGFVGIIRDVSRETESERALAASERRLMSLAENAPVGIFQFDNEGNALFLNDEWARMHGMTVEEGLGKGWQRILDDEQKAHYASYAAERQAGATTDIEAVVHRPDGSSCRVRAVTTAVFGNDGELIGRMGVVVDQTKEYEAREALKSALEEARAAAVAKDRFLALMSHELRTPMNGVLGFAERLQESPLNEAQRRYASLITRSGEIMLALLNDILDTSRMREGQLQLAHQPYDLAATLTSVCAHFEALAARRSLQLRCNFASPLPRHVLGDRQRLTQILNNLLGNSLKFTEVGWISVYARIEPQYGRTILIVEVTDTGIGIAPEDQEGIFEAFEQGAKDTAIRFGGTGLGLPIARGLAEQMGGSLRLVTSNVGKGSIFRLTLPLDIPADAAPSLPQAVPSKAAAPQRRPQRGLQLLVAEDNEINRYLITDLLADSGCELTIVADGQQAVDAVIQAADWGQPFDLVLMDLRMPVLDGIGATTAIRARGFDAAKLPIIAVTASVHTAAMDACWQAGMQDYITKPVTRAAIDATLEKWGRRDSRSKADSAVTAPPLAPELAPLLARFIEQCSDCLAAVSAMVAVWPDEDRARRSAVQSMAHSVAGLAATFAAPQLVAPAQALDLAFDTGDDDLTGMKLAEMEASLKDYLAAQQPAGNNAA